LTCAPDLPNEVNGYKNRIPDSILAARVDGQYQYVDHAEI